jgi:hypothetical protein
VLVPIQTAQFLIAIGSGIAIGTSHAGLGQSVAWTVLVALGLSLVTVIVEGRRLPRAMQSPYGITFQKGLFTYLFFGTITAIGVSAVVVRLLAQALGR